MNGLATSWMVCLALAVLPATAEVYKWVDERGKVNYGDMPPGGSKGARALDESSGSVSIVPGMPAQEIERLRTRYEQQRMQELERQIDVLLARERAPAVPQPAYTEVYVPVYGYAWPWGRFAQAGHPGPRPDRPIRKGSRPPPRSQSLPAR